MRKALADAGIEQDQEIIQIAQKILQKGTSDHKHVTIGVITGGQLYIGRKQTLKNHLETKKKKRPLGILKGKASYKIKGDFKITDDEFLSS